MHYDLAQNIFAINEVVQPNLIIVDGLIGMEGNGPGDGDPFRLGHIFVSDNTFLNDLVVCRAVDMPWRDVGYMVHANTAGRFDQALADEVAAKVPIIRAIRRAPPRSKLAELAEAPSLLWLKKIVRPVVDRPEVAETAYKLKIIQDVYNLEDDSLRIAGRNADLCGTCKKCEDFCPTKLSVDEIGVKLDDDDCVHCLYCWFVCPEDAIQLVGDANHLTRQIDRYRAQIQSL
jgi:ferredoxin